MAKILDPITWTATRGREPQNFLGGRWVEPFLHRLDEDRQRRWALRFVSTSPHYFLTPDDPQYDGMGRDEYLEAAGQEFADSRRRVHDEILADHLRPEQRVLDYGCGPGYLARATADNVGHVDACDISRGALACARILNPHPDVTYRSLLDGELGGVGDATIDVAYAFAVLQHVTDDVAAGILVDCARTLRPGGRLLLHIQLEDERWRSEEQWRSDRSMAGRLRFRFGLHCFARSEAHHRDLVAAAGFDDISITGLDELVADSDGAIASQALLTATRPG